MFCFYIDFHHSHFKCFVPLAPQIPPCVSLRFAGGLYLLADRMTLAELNAVTQNWEKRTVPSSENPGLLEVSGWPLLHRKTQLKAVVDHTGSPLSSDVATRTVLATHAPPGSGKTRFLRTLTLPFDQIESFMALETAEEVAAVAQWAEEVLRVHISFNGKTSYAQHESGNEYVWIGRRLLHAFFDVSFATVRSMTPDVNDVVTLVLHRANKRRLLLCVDELAVTERGKDVATACKVLQCTFAGMGSDVNTRLDVQALVSTLDSSIGVVEKTSQMVLTWVHLDPVPDTDMIGYMQKDGELGETLLLALKECGGHPRTVEYILLALQNNSADLVDYAVRKLCAEYMDVMVRNRRHLPAGVFAYVMAHVVLRREMPWDDDGHTATLNSISWLLLNSRRERETTAVPFSSPVFLRAAVRSFTDTGNLHDGTVVDLLQHVLLPDRARLDDLGFETFHARWAAMRMWAHMHLKDETVTLRKLFEGAQMSVDLEDKDLRLRPVMLPSASIGPFGNGAHLQCGQVSCFPANTPGVDVLGIWRVDSDVIVPFLELVQLKYFVKTEKLDIGAVRKSVNYSRAVVSSIVEHHTVPMKMDGSKTALATEVYLPVGFVCTNDVVVVAGTFDATNYGTLPERTIVIPINALLNLYGPTFRSMAQVQLVMWQRKYRQ